jgi:2-polyprenyl-3-methyl-5-hydroxy-6-metoxy-1,4-benzoquinol methylase
MGKINGLYGKQVWERKIKEQDEVGVIIGTVGSIKELKKYTQIGMQQIESEVIPLIKKKGKVLDLGVGPLARFAIEFSKRGFNTTGIDISPTTLDYAKRYAEESQSKIELIQGDITELDKIKGKFDFIYCIATFYHIPPHLTGISLMKIKEKLEDGGYALIEFGVLTKKSLREKIRELFYWVGHYTKRLLRKGFNVNISRFTNREINEMLIKSGLRIEKVLLGNLYLLKKNDERF